MMDNIPVIKLGLVAVSRDCFPIALSEKRRAAIAEKCGQKNLDFVEIKTTVENEKDMLKAVDEGWNVIITLTSSNTALAEQTEDRIKDDFTKAAVYTQIPLNFRTSEVPGSPTLLQAANNTSFYWGVAMKEVHNLGTILAWLKQNGNIVPNMRILVIDDEADNATPDSNTGKNNQLTESEMEDLIAIGVQIRILD